LKRQIIRFKLTDLILTRQVHDFVVDNGGLTMTF